MRKWMVRKESIVIYFVAGELYRLSDL